MNDELLRQLKSTLSAACKGASEVLMSHFGNLKEIGHKGDVNLVTEADREAERQAVAIIRADFPRHAILAEESGSSNSGEDNAIRWIIDPLDGTTNFAHTLPIFSVSIGVESHGRMILGMVQAPVLGETYFAEHGQGATLNGRKVHVSSINRLREALSATGFAYDRHERPEYYLKYVAEILRQTQDIRRAGCASLDLCAVACGRADLYFEEGIHPWDVAAGKLIVEEAGGKVTNYLGEPYDIMGRQIAATNGHLHAPLIEVLKMIWEETRLA